MESLDKVRERAGVCLTSLSIHLSAHGAHISELLTAEIPAHRVEALYPFEIEDWKIPCRELAFSQGGLPKDFHGLIPTFSVLTELTRCIPRQKASATALRQAMDSMGRGTGNFSGRLHRMLATGLMLHALAELEVINGPTAARFPSRLQEFFSQAEALLQALPPEANS